MNQPAIQQTSDYKKFSLHYKNRQVNWSKVERLAESMRKRNLLNLYPIIINKKNEILDGQHRFEAAKLAKCEIFFLISCSGYDIENVAESNSFQKGWNTGDYIRYYARCEKPEYLKVLTLAKKYKVKPTAITSLVNTFHDKIRKGEFILSDEGLVVDILNHAKTIGIEYGFTGWNTRDFLRALKFLLGIKGYNKLRMGQKIQANRSKLIRQGRVVDYVQMLEEIYNMNATEQLRFT